MNNERQRRIETMQVFKFLPYMQYWVLILIFAGLLALGVFICFVIPECFDKIRVGVVIMPFVFFLWYLIRWISIQVIFTKDGIIRKDSRTKKEVFTPWDNMNYAYFIVEGKDHRYILLSSRRLTFLEVTKKWKNAQSIKAFFNSDDICFLIDRKKEDIISYIRYNTNSQHVTFIDDAYRIRYIKLRK